MTELLLVLAIFLMQKKSQGGFGQFEDPRQNQVFFVNEREDVEILVNGHWSGVKGSGSLFVDSCHHTLFVEYFIQGQKITESWIPLTHRKVFVMGPDPWQLPKVYPWRAQTSFDL